MIRHDRSAVSGKGARSSSMRQTEKMIKVRNDGVHSRHKCLLWALFYFGGI